MVFCSVCGVVAPDTAKFCPACGAEIQITKPESSNGENLIHEDLGNVAESPRPRSHAPLIWGGGTFLVILVLIIVVFAGGGSNTDTTSNSSNNGSAIQTSDIVQNFSSNLGVSLNQNDAFRGITFPHISKDVDIWSAPYVTILIYPDAATEVSDSQNLQDDITNLNSDRTAEVCQNFVVVFPSNLQDKVDMTVNLWCNSGTPSPSTAPDQGSGDKNSSYRLGYDNGIQLSNANSFFYYSGQPSELCNLTVTTAQAGTTNDGTDWSQVNVQDFDRGCMDAYASTHDGLRTTTN